ncbi:AraC family transcriptional regulator [Nitratidesulfovibrio sp. SRB-5]|uniref:AraC family transcriptional regulator n=1 Tax=Nitratidesulfovibrio sp. SRB-5 TaxID=2872636 RepID=UPI0010268806|nr:AraC family transcriptional regulator [Nitratidesulfovibrio sp. SRB-5]MBZ2172230.1 AraC family transcriptional regulator [Nitratidesulfovibrio sp. SRB-5]RXF76085.1 AraC family transcriptional regulator [Desulfovibrio sp. DS-1]
MSRTPRHAAVRFWRDPDLPEVEVRRSSYNEETFRRHTHAAYSIGIMDGGAASFMLEGASHWAVAGQLVLIEPDRVHACNPDRDTFFAYRMFYVDPAWLAELAGQAELAELASAPEPPEHLAPANARGASGERAGSGAPGEPGASGTPDDCASPAPLPRFRAPVVDCAQTMAAWSALYDAVSRGDSVLEKQSLLVQAAELLLARHCLPASGAGPATNPSFPADAPPQPRPAAAAPRPETAVPPETTAIIDAVRRHLRDHVADPVRLDDLARLAGRSRCHLLRMFQQATGLPPHAYQTQLRVEAAKGLLAAGHSISHVAAETGFSDQSHFSRVFRDLTGATPRQYQQGGADAQHAGATTADA